MEYSEVNGDSEIAIVGMACRFPGADTVETFWRNLREGHESTTFFTDEELLAAGVDAAELALSGFVKAGQILPGVELFDADHFGITGDDAEILDPQHRHFLECSVAALQDAGYDPSTYADDIGVFAGAGMNTYVLANLASRYAGGSSIGRYRLMLANDKDFLATRVSYKLNLRGPSINVNTACSTSLVAVHQACLSLLSGECQMALAGAVHVRLPQDEGYVYQEGMIFSPDGHCRTFDADARGTVIGSGVGIVVLKPLSEAVADGDFIHAVIKGTAVNNDGSAKAGYTAPSVERQAAVITEAQRVANCPPHTVGYVEAHGTATPLGDPIEVAALTKAFGRTAAGRTALGSVKTNVGHLDTAAGMAGLIKTSLRLRHRTLVPSLNFRTPNPDIDFVDGPFRVNTELAKWPANDGPRRAGVSSFGVGGTNAHAILEEPPPPPSPAPARGAELLVLSAATPDALARTTRDLARHLQGHPERELAAVAHTLAVGRRQHAHRRAVVCADIRDAALSLAILDPDRVRTARSDQAPARFSFVFPASPAGAARGSTELYQEVGAFRTAVDACASALPGHPVPEPEALLTGGAGADLAAFTTQYAMAKACLSWGIRPSALVGAGPGRVVAGCLGGVFDLADALAVVAGRDAADLATLTEPRLRISVGSGRRWLQAGESADPATWAWTDAAEGDEQTTADLLQGAGLLAVDFGLPGNSEHHALETLLTAVGGAWTGGAEVDWSAWYGLGRTRRVPLPTYSFERTRYWVDPAARPPPTSAPRNTLRSRVERASDIHRSEIFQEFLRRQVANVLEDDDLQVRAEEDLYDLGVDSLILIDIIARLAAEVGRPVPLSLPDQPTIRAIADQAAHSWGTEAPKKEPTE